MLGGNSPLMNLAVVQNLHRSSDSLPSQEVVSTATAMQNGAVSTLVSVGAGSI